MSELRQDPATKRWVIISTERAKRPHDFIRKSTVETEPEHRDDCPFCTGNEHNTPPELYAIRDGTAPDTPGWKVRVIPNRFAALSSTAMLNVEFPDIFTTISGFGAHEVIVETPVHNQSIGMQPLEQVERVIQATGHRMLALAQDHRIHFVAVFRNHGLSAGTSLAHPHSQMIATPIVPTNVREEIEEARRFYDDRVQCVYCYLLNEELAKGERVIFQTDDYAVLAPFASRYPFEMMILPKEHGASFLNDSNGNRLKSLAFVLKSALHLLNVAANNPDYNLVLHNAPTRDRCMDYFHWHIEILPRMTTAAGFELGTGIYITTAIPEQTAEYLRDSYNKLKEE